MPSTTNMMTLAVGTQRVIANNKFLGFTPRPGQGDNFCQDPKVDPNPTSFVQNKSNDFAKEIQPVVLTKYETVCKHFEEKCGQDARFPFVKKDVYAGLLSMSVDATNNFINLYTEHKIAKLEEFHINKCSIEDDELEMYDFIGFVFGVEPKLVEDRRATWGLAPTRMNWTTNLNEAPVGGSLMQLGASAPTAGARSGSDAFIDFDDKRILPFKKDDSLSIWNDLMALADDPFIRETDFQKRAKNIYAEDSVYFRAMRFVKVVASDRREVYVPGLCMTKLITNRVMKQFGIQDTVYFLSGGLLQREDAFTEFHNDCYVGYPRPYETHACFFHDFITVTSKTRLSKRVRDENHNKVNIMNLMENDADPMDRFVGGLLSENGPGIAAFHCLLAYSRFLTTNTRVLADGSDFDENVRSMYTSNFKAGKTLTPEEIAALNAIVSQFEEKLDSVAEQDTVHTNLKRLWRDEEVKDKLTTGPAGNRMIIYNACRVKMIFWSLAVCRRSFNYWMVTGEGAKALLYHDSRNQPPSDRNGVKFREEFVHNASSIITKKQPRSLNLGNSDFIDHRYVLRKFLSHGELSLNKEGEITDSHSAPSYNLGFVIAEKGGGTLIDAADVDHAGYNPNRRAKVAPNVDVRISMVSKLFMRFIVQICVLLFGVEELQHRLRVALIDSVRLELCSSELNLPNVTPGFFEFPLPDSLVPGSQGIKFSFTDVLLFEMSFERSASRSVWYSSFTHMITSLSELGMPSQPLAVVKLVEPGGYPCASGVRTATEDERQCLVDTAARLDEHFKSLMQLPSHQEVLRSLGPGFDLSVSGSDPSSPKQEKGCDDSEDGDSEASADSSSTSSESGRSRRRRPCRVCSVQ